MSRKANQLRKESMYAVCPLFVGTKEREIHCLPHVPDSRRTAVIFETPEGMRKQKRIFCEGCFERCEHYLSWKHFQWVEDEDK